MSRRNVANVFGDDDDDDVPRRTLHKLPTSAPAQKPSATSAASAPAAAAAAAPASGAGASGGSKPKAAKDFSHLLQDIDDSAMMEAMGFSGFGKKKKQTEELNMALLDTAKRSRGGLKAQDDEAPAGATVVDVAAADIKPEEPKRKTAALPKKKSGDGDGSDDDEEEEDADMEGVEEGADPDDSGSFVPISHELTLKHGSKDVYALDVDPSGARPVTGAVDFDVKFWDFGSMTRGLEHFRHLKEPCGAHQIRSLAYSSTGDRVLIAAANSQAKILDRNGYPLMECLKGDQYFNDLTKTHGHVAMLHEAVWHPSNKDQFCTCSYDGTVRIWDANDHKKSVIVSRARTRQGKRDPIHSVAFAMDGKLIVGGCEDGSIQTWAPSDRMMRMHKSVYDQHKGVVTSVLFGRDKNNIYSRSYDGTVKLWDLRKFKTAVATAEGLPNSIPTTNVSFTPNEAMVMTGTSVVDGQGSFLAMLDATTLELKYKYAISPSASVIRTLWHPRINQMFASLSDGTAKVFFDPKKSLRGANMCVVRQPRVADPLDFGDVKGTIVTPHALKLFKEDIKSQQMTTKRKREKMRKDPKATKQPELPVHMTGTKGTTGKGGRLLGYSGSLSQYLAKKTSYDPTRDEDPREAILKYAEAAEKDPYFSGPAYAKTQPDPVYDMREHEDEDEDGQATKRHKFDPFKKPV